MAFEACAPLDAEFPSDDGDLFEDGVLFEEFSLEEEEISFEDCTWDAKAVAFKEPVLEPSAPLDIEVPSDAGISFDDGTWVAEAWRVLVLETGVPFVIEIPPVSGIPFDARL